jgi:hypothetical protein
MANNKLPTKSILTTNPQQMKRSCQADSFDEHQEVHEPSGQNMTKLSGP